MKKVQTGFLAKLKKMLVNLEDVRTTDGKDLVVDGDLEVGKDIMIATEDGEYEPAPSGEYDTGEVVIVVESGRITEIREAAAGGEGGGEGEGEGNAEDMHKQKFAAFVQKLSATYEERIRMISAAIIALGYSEYGYVVEASDESAVWCYWDEAAQEEHFVQFTLTWADDTVTASDPVEVVPSFKPKEGGEGAAAERTAEEVDAIVAENEQLKAQVAELKAQAVVPPADADKGDAEKPLANKFIENARKRQ